MNRVGLYCRISLDQEGKELGVKRQQQDCEALAERRGWTAAKPYYIDNGISAYDPKAHRPEFERLLSDLKAGIIDGIVAYDLDRISRQPKELERIVDIYQSRQDLVFATVQGDIDLSTGDGLTLARVMITFANKSSMDTSRRMRRKHLERAEQGLPHGTGRVFGYSGDRSAFVGEEVALLREFARMSVTGHNLRDIAYWANQQGYKTVRGAQWRAVIVRNLLVNPRYVGIRVHNGVEYPATWEPVFTKDEWEHLQLALKLRRDKYAANPKPRGRKFLLTGIAHCGRCGEPMNGRHARGRPHQENRPTYYCRKWGDTEETKGCGTVVRVADAVDDYVVQSIFHRLDSPAMAKLIEGKQDDSELRALLTERERHQMTLDGLVDDYASGLLDRQQLKRAKAVAEGLLDKVNHQIELLQRERIGIGIGAGETIRQAWERNDSLSWRRTFIELLVEKVIIRPGKSWVRYELANGRVRWFDPSLVTIRWRV